MIKKIFFSALISIGIVIAVVLLGRILVSCLSLNQVLTAESARYVFSAVSQSMAAIFALTFVIAGWITSYTARDLAKHVFRYFSSLYLTLITVFLFVFTIVINFIYLGFTDDSNVGITCLGHYSYGLFASILLFIGSTSLLIFYAANTYRVSVSPFKYFYNVVKEGIIPGLESLKKYIELGNSIKDLREQAKLEYSYEWVRRLGKDKLITSRDKEGYLTFIDINSVNMAYHQINKNSSTSKKIYYLAEIGENIPINAAVFSFEPVDPEIDKRVKELLSGAYKIKKKNKNQPGWVNEFEYIDPLFKAVENEITDTATLNFYVEKLVNLARYDIEKRNRILFKSKESLKEIKCFWLLDRWTEGYYQLIKESCIAKGEMVRSGRMLEWKDKPDTFLIQGLKNLVPTVYENDEVNYLEKIFESIFSYAKFNSKVDEPTDFRITYLEELKSISMHIFNSVQNELNQLGALVKLEKFVSLIIRYHLFTFRDLSMAGSTYEMVFDGCDFLYNQFVIDIENELTALSDYLDNKDAKNMKNIRISIISILLIIAIYVLKEVKESQFNYNVYITIHREFWDRFSYNYRGINGDLSLLKTMFENSCEYLESSGWFSHRAEKSDVYGKIKSVQDTRVRTEDYCHYAYIFSLFLLRYTITIQHIEKSYWITEGFGALKAHYKEIKDIISDPMSKFYLILKNFCDHDTNKLKNRIAELDKLFEERDA